MLLIFNICFYNALYQFFVSGYIQYRSLHVLTFVAWSRCAGMTFESLTNHQCDALIFKPPLHDGRFTETPQSITSFDGMVLSDITHLIKTVNKTQPLKQQHGT